MLTANISQEMSQWQQTNNSLDPCIRSLMAVSPLHSPWKHWYDLLLPHLLHLIIVASGKQVVSQTSALRNVFSQLTHCGVCQNVCASAV